MTYQTRVERTETTDAVIELLRVLGPSGPLRRAFELFRQVHGDTGMICP